MATTLYPQPNITNYTGLIDYANQVTMVEGVGVFAPSLCFLVFIVAFMGINTSGHNPLNSAIVSSFITWVLSIMMSILGWIDVNIVVIFAIMFAVSTALSFWKGKEPWE